MLGNLLIYCVYIYEEHLLMKVHSNQCLKGLLSHNCHQLNFDIDKKWFLEPPFPEDGDWRRPLFVSEYLLFQLASFHSHTMEDRITLAQRFIARRDRPGVSPIRQ
jgi:hypothetical protein